MLRSAVNSHADYATWLGVAHGKVENCWYARTEEVETTCRVIAIVLEMSAIAYANPHELFIVIINKFVLIKTFPSMKCFEMRLKTLQTFDVN